MNKLEHHLKLILALMWGTGISAEKILLAARALGFVHPDGSPYTAAEVQPVLEGTDTEKVFHFRDEYSFRRPRPNSLYRELIDTVPVERLKQAILSTGPNGIATPQLRLALLTGDREYLDALEPGKLNIRSQETAVLEDFDAELFSCIPATYVMHFYHVALNQLLDKWDEDMRPAVDHLLQLPDGKLAEQSPEFQLRIIEALILRGETERAQQFIASQPDAIARKLRACLSMNTAQWRTGLEAFEQADRPITMNIRGQGKVAIPAPGGIPSNLEWFYPWSLLRTGDLEHLGKAYQFCLLRNNPTTTDEGKQSWHLWTTAIILRFKDKVTKKVLSSNAFRTYDLWNFNTYSFGDEGAEGFWQILLYAWLWKLGDANVRAHVAFDDISDALEKLRQLMQACGWKWLEPTLDEAVASLRGKKAADKGRLTWRDVLNGLSEMGSPPAQESERRLVWSFKLDDDRFSARVEPMWQQRKADGWAAPQTASLESIAAAEDLPSYDRGVTAAIDTLMGGSYHLDQDGALMALIGHPHVILAGESDHFIEVVEGLPWIEVLQDGDQLEVTMRPLPLSWRRRLEPLDGDSSRRRHKESRDEWDETSVIRDGAGQVRVIRHTPAQYAAVMFLKTGLSLPASAREELNRALSAVSKHFEIRGEHAQAAEEVPAETRLRAELVPRGDCFSLMLKAAPFGLDGPRLSPGLGRTRVVLARAGKSVSTRRDLAAEIANCAAVCDALPQLQGPEGANAWMIDDPTQALEILEHLPDIPELAGVDWPKGGAKRVLRVDMPQMQISVKHKRGWFELSGEVQVDESLVLKLTDLVTAAKGKTRFVQMGNGAYLALTQSLQQRLAELGRLTESDKDGLLLPPVASLWLDEAIEGMPVKTDKAFRESIERLQVAQDLKPVVPATFQAELRPYQQEGYAWAMRLAHAGLGGCLADDMGLGKTLQSLAVLLARSAGGPALIVAPTSVCGNWVAEGRRFAPALEMRLYGSADEEARDLMLADAKPGQVIVASYTLIQQDIEDFDAHPWHTIIIDEAQSIKNASTKRAKAAFELDADFRLALSGTPIENRLSELWSIMRFVAPGLLASQQRFAERFAKPIEEDNDHASRQLLKRLISPFMLRRTKAQVLDDLPPRTEILWPVEPEEREIAHYEALRREAAAVASKALDGGDEQAKFRILAELTRLRRAACDPRLPTPDYAERGAKVQAFADLAARLSANGHKALVFSQFVDFLEMLMVPLKEAGIRYQYIDGSTPADERTQRVAAFQAGEGEMFLISLKAGGFGLNLTAADHVVITDPWWNPAVEDQAMGRAHRIGQRRPVTVYRLVTQGTVEERIIEMHHDKRALAESMLDEGDAATLPSTEDLMALMLD